VPLAPCLPPIHLTKSQVTLGGQSSATVLILRGVAQDCPMSPTLLRIEGNGIFNKMHQADQLKGNPSTDCQDKLGGKVFLVRR
jgi:hypothetical protein